MEDTLEYVAREMGLDPSEVKELQEPKDTHVHELDGYRR